MKRFFALFFAASLAISAAAQQKCSIQVLGHRGGRYETDENTLAAFVESYKNGVRAYETDFRLTADNQLVVSHDSSLKRTAGVDIDVEKSTREQIKAVKTLKGNPILFLDELAEFFSKTKITYIEWEMKSNNYTEEQLKVYCDKAYKTVMPSKPEGAIYVFSSFDKRSIQMMKKLHPDAECMYITSRPLNTEVLEDLKEIGVKRVGCTINGTSRKDMKEAHKQGVIVNLWPGSNIEDFQLAIAIGADIACTDIPVTVLKFVKKNMPWVTPTNNLKLK